MLSFSVQIEFKPACLERKFHSKGEEDCYMKLFEVFPCEPLLHTRPEWLVNPETGRCLELDFYYPQLNVAIDYNGQQHYCFPNNFHKTYEEFLAQVRRDNMKADLCAAHGVMYVAVPYNIPREQIPAYVKWSLGQASPLARRSGVMLL